MDRRTFAVERLGVGDWPRTDGLGDVVITPEEWRRVADPESGIEGTVVFAVDISPDRRHTAVCAAGARGDGVIHVEVVEHKAGTGWVSDRLAELVAKHDGAGVVIDERGPAAALVGELASRSVTVVEVNAQEYTQACGLFYDAVAEQQLRHLGTRELESAVRGARKRPLGDAWAWSRKNSTVDITPLVAATLAYAAAAAHTPDAWLGSW